MKRTLKILFRLIKRATHFRVSLQTIGYLTTGIFLYTTLFNLSIPIHIAHATKIKFADKTNESGLSAENGPTFGASWGDFDQDGWEDLHIRNHGNPPKLYKNIGDGTFADVTHQYGITENGDLHGASWADYDNDGDLDLYQVLGSPESNKINFLYRYDRDLSLFKQISEPMGLADPDGRGRTPIWMDYDLDGLLDIVLCNRLGENSYSRIFKNMGIQTFLEQPGRKQIPLIGGSLGDIDNDGDLDLILAGGHFFLIMRNEGNGIFTDITNSAGFAGQTRVYDTALGDFDSDGDLDVYLVRRNYDDDRYLIENQYLYYTLNVSYGEEKGFNISVQSPVVVFDIYRFGKPEFIENIYLGLTAHNPTEMPFTGDERLPEYHGQPSYVPGKDCGTYIWFDTEKNEWRVRHSAGDDCRAAFGVTILSTENTIGGMPINLDMDNLTVPNRLFQNQGDCSFIDVTNDTKIGDTRQGASAVWEDLDNDGDLDLYVVNCGRILNESNVLYENLGNGSFLDITEVAGLSLVTAGRGESVAFADYDNNGTMDLIVLNGYGPAPFCDGPRVLLSNVSEPMNWVQVKLEGKKSNRDAIGAAVTVKSGEIQTTKQQTGGIHCFTQNTQILHFGMNNEHIVEELTIRWPSQRVQKYFDLDINSRVVIREPEIGVNLESEEIMVPISGYLTMNVWLQNHSDSEKRFFYGSKIKLPNGKMYPYNKDFLFGPQEVVLLPYQLKSIRVAHQIPTTAPIGFYTYYGYVGSSIKDVWNQDAFYFNVTADIKN